MAKKTETRPTTGHINPFGLRMQPELREQMEAAATASGRSLNAEIVARLEASFLPPPKDAAATVVAEQILKAVRDTFATVGIQIDELNLVDQGRVIAQSKKTSSK